MFDASRLNEPAILSHYRLNQVQRAIQADLSQPMTLHSAARLAGLEPHYFCALFHSRAGVRFKEWVTHVRIGAAKQLLASSDQRITDIAFLVGYNDLRSFERAFLRHSAMTPVQFRRSHATREATASAGGVKADPY